MHETLTLGPGDAGDVHGDLASVVGVRIGLVEERVPICGDVAANSAGRHLLVQIGQGAVEALQDRVLAHLRPIVGIRCHRVLDLLETGVGLGGCALVLTLKGGRVRGAFVPK
nr:hypothetical protein [Candidatus Microthrix sp.]